MLCMCRAGAGAGRGRPLFWPGLTMACGVPALPCQVSAHRWRRVVARNRRN